MAVGQPDSAGEGGENRWREAGRGQFPHFNGYQQAVLGINENFLDDMTY